MIHLTLEQLLQLHILVVSATGGADGVRDVGRLESAVQVQSQQVFDADIYPELYDKAAAMIRNIITDHPFVDGNKRTAMLVGLTLLELNGMRFVAQPGELEDFAVAVATDHLSVADIAQWLRRHTTSAPIATR